MKSYDDFEAALNNLIEDIENSDNVVYGKKTFNDNVINDINIIDTDIIKDPLHSIKSSDDEISDSEQHYCQDEIIENLSNKNIFLEKFDRTNKILLIHCLIESLLFFVIIIQMYYR